MAIDDERTLEIYGYTSDELKPQSGMPIVVVCDECERYRHVQKRQYSELCHSCANKKRFEDDPTLRERMSIAQRKRFEDPNEHEKHSIANKKRFEDDPTLRERMSIAQRKRFEDDPTLIDRISGENAPNWQGGISFGKYCPKFNDKIKQYIRNKYNNCDYISGLPDYICNPHRKLDVHHIDYNKEQGCNDHEWRLIPMSMKNHMHTNFNRDFWNRLFTYSLQYDETYYIDKHINIMEMT